MNHHVAEEEKEHTHVLIIGNGFDIEHGLKTQYGDFFENRGQIGNALHNNFYESPDPMFFGSGYFYWDMFRLYKREDMPYAFYKDIKDILDHKMSGNWFDFEEVIYLFVKGLNKEIGNPTKLEELDHPITSLYEFIKDINSAINKRYEDLRYCVQNLHDYLCEQYEDITEELQEIAETPIGKKNIIYGLLGKWVVTNLKSSHPILSQPEEEKLERDHNYFQSCFEQYISFLKERHKERFNRSKKDSKFQSFLEKVINKHKLMVLNFNYTKVFEKLYEEDFRDKGIDNIKHHHIHGYINKAFMRELQRLEKNDHCIDPNKINLVLGCRSFESNDNIYSGFVVFTKARQRETCGTIEGYKEFLDELEKCQNITFHIIGHSLGKTDHDILKEILGFQNSRIRVYYHNEEAHCRLKKNMIHIIGEEDVKKRVDFICQYDPQEGVFPSRCLNIG
ncbi:MAG: hypothetical protein IIT88_01415 [Acetobacter sp.]|nr:hypothetical protein [Acetobacter sp.]